MYYSCLEPIIIYYLDNFPLKTEIRWKLLDIKRRYGYYPLNHIRELMNFANTHMEKVDSKELKKGDLVAFPFPHRFHLGVVDERERIITTDPFSGKKVKVEPQSVKLNHVWRIPDNWYSINNHEEIG